MLLLASSRTSSSELNLSTEATGPKICKKGSERSVRDAFMTRNRFGGGQAFAHLFLHTLEAGLAVGQDGRLDEEALVAVRVPLLAASGKRRALAHARFDIREHLVALLRRDQRAEGRLLVERLVRGNDKSKLRLSGFEEKWPSTYVSDRASLGLLHKELDKLVVHILKLCRKKVSVVLWRRR